MPRSNDDDHSTGILAKITKEVDSTGNLNELFMGALSSTHSAHLKLAGQQQLDKKSGDEVIRALCSPQLNSLLAVDAAFLKCKPDSPLE